jgi:hypothetical protein
MTTIRTTPALAATGLLLLTLAGCGSTGTSASPRILGHAHGAHRDRRRRHRADAEPGPGRLRGHRRQPLVPARAGHGVDLHQRGRRRPADGRGHGHAPDQGDPGRDHRGGARRGPRRRGKLVENTYDWYAQDRDGNVWYFGEDTTAYDSGKPDTEGSWEAGKDNARAGVAMLGHPDVDDAYSQEYLKGVAEDHGKVLSLTKKVTGPTGTYAGVLQTEDTTPLEPKLVEHKYYARGVGVVAEETVAGGHEQVRLVGLRRP